MIKDNQTLLNRIHLLLDAIIAAGSYMLAWYIWFESPMKQVEDNVGRLPMETYFYALYFIVPGYIILYYAFNLYTSKRTSRQRYEIFSIIKSNLMGVAVFLIALYVVNEPNFSRGMIFVFFVLNVILTSVFRVVLRKLLKFFRKKGYNVKHVLLVGYSRAAEEYIRRIVENPQWGYEVAGILDNEVPVGTSYKGVKVLGKFDEIHIILDNNQFDEIAVTLSLKDYDYLEDMVSICEKTGTHTKFIPDYNSLVPSQPYTEDLGGLPVINIRYVPLSNPLNAFIKRLIDIVGSLVGIIITSPLLLVIAILVKCTSKGPIIFKQERVGLHNKSFNMYKFRSMKIQNEAEEVKAWTVKDDPRVTKVGRFIRKTSIDELPQLFNILIGQMSLVGPRPERPHFVEKFKEEIPRYMVKHQVRPGLTGWAQVNGYRGDTSIRKRIEYDIEYIENWSLEFDFRILFLTIFKGFINKNAY